MTRLAPLALCALLLLAVPLSGCRGPVESLVGEYEAEAGGLISAPRLNLRSDGGGGLTVGAEDAAFRWEVKDSQVLLHTRQGGMVLLKRTAQGLEGDLPGVGRVVFRKK